MKLQQLAKPALLLLLLILSVCSYAQEKDVSGQVIEKQTGEPLAGVTVSVKGTPRSTVTDINGLFKLKAAATETLQFSYVGFEVQEMKVGSRTTFSASLLKSTNSMEDVVVVGYGQIPKPKILGAVATINPREIEDLPAANLSTLLQNRVPGVSVSQSSGRPGSSTSIVIRAPVTFGSGGSIEPLFIIDGIAYDGTTGSVSNGRIAFDLLDASMIESISFLKDAAASIYGARGANGVVLVTTKKGKPGKARVSYSGTYGLSSAPKLPEMLTSFEHATALNNKYLSRGNPSYYTNGAINHLYTDTELEYLKGNNYNWLDQVWENSNLTRHTINVSGGTDKITFFAGANYYYETGNLKDLYVKNYGLRFGSNAKITDGLTASVIVSTDNGLQDRPSPEGLSGITDQSDQMNGVMTGLLLTPRWQHFYIDGLPVYAAAGNWHPQEFLKTGSYKRTRSTGTNINATLEYKIPHIKGLTFRVQYGLNRRNSLGKEYSVSYPLYNFVRTGAHGNYNGITSQNVVFTGNLTSSPITNITNDNRLSLTSNASTSYQLNEAIPYNRTFGDHEISVMALAEQSENNGESFMALAERQVIPGVDELWAFSQDRANYDHSSSRNENGRASYLGRLNYSYKNRYLLEAVLRADASPIFPKDGRWGYFPSVAVGWRISEEKFFQDRFRSINNLKIRFQVGLTGFDAVRNYQYLERYTQTTGMLFGGSMTNGLNNNAVSNPYITWEKALYKNLGIDGSVFNSKFDFTIDLFHRYNYDMLQTSTSTVPSTFGGTIADQNYGKLKSYGIEGSLTYNGQIGRDFSYNVGMIFNMNDNKIIKKYYAPLTDTGYKYPIGRRTDGGIEGYYSTGIVRTQAEIDDWYKDHPGWKINGDSLRLGYLNFVDINGDGVIDGNDKTRIAPRSGALFGMGFNLSCAWKGFRLRVSISMVVGGQKEYDKTARTPPNETNNALGIWRDSWSPSNPNAAYPVINAPFANEVSNFWLRSATAARVNNMQLSYTFPASISNKLKIPDIRAFITGTNLWTIINNQPYKDPATNLVIDYPMLRTFSFGLNVSM